jgi:hypothetical protein
VVWIYLGAESVFFYPPGSVEEHLVVEHGIPSVDMHWKVKGYYSHEGDHRKQQSVRSGAVGDLLAVTMATRRRHDPGAHMGHGPPDNGGHEGITRDRHISGLPGKPYGPGAPTTACLFSLR